MTDSAPSQSLLYLVVQHQLEPGEAAPLLQAEQLGPRGGGVAEVDQPQPARPACIGRSGLSKSTEQSAAALVRPLALEEGPAAAGGGRRASGRRGRHRLSPAAEPRATVDISRRRQLEGGRELITHRARRSSGPGRRNERPGSRPRGAQPRLGRRGRRPRPADAGGAAAPLRPR
eukprot:SAG22_NODE_1844_length_3454_cov_2.054844_3_plen_174_part_00